MVKHCYVGFNWVQLLKGDRSEACIEEEVQLLFYPSCPFIYSATHARSFPAFEIVVDFKFIRYRISQYRVLIGDLFYNGLLD